MKNLKYIHYFFYLSFLYCTYHILQGERGAFSWIGMNRKVFSQKENLLSLQEKKNKIERLVSSLRSDNLSLDLLEERAYTILGVRHPQEIQVSPYDLEFK